MENKQIIIHVGPAKTGTSALQYFLLKNQNELKKVGYYYPDHHTDGNSVSDGHASFNIKELINNFLESNYHTLILSSEYFWLQINEINSLHSNIKFVSFYRCSVYQWTSQYIQKIKRKNTTQKFNANKIKRRPNKIHLLNIEKDNLDYSIIPYNFDFSETWSIGNEFLKFIEKNDDLNHLYETQIRVINPSYSIEAFEFKRYINKFIKFRREKPVNKLTLDRLDKILQKFSEGETNFSFLDDEQFEKNKKTEIFFLKKLIFNYKQTNLKSILEYVEKSTNNNPITQILSEEQVSKIVNYVANEDIRLLRAIVKCIPSNSDNAFYKQFNNLGLQQMEDTNKKFNKILKNFLGRFEINEIPKNLIETYSDITDIDIDELKSRAVLEPKIMHSIVSFAKGNHLDVYEKKIPKTSNKSAVIIEDRELPHLAALLKISINNLSEQWSHKLVCTKNSKQKMQEYCDKINPNIEVIAVDVESFTQETYNNSILKKEFWESIDAEHILIYQQDAVVFKNNIDDFLEYDYIGAPWLAHQDDNAIGVGNGGFALRKKSTLLKCLETVHPRKLKLSKSTTSYMKSTGLSLPPEDVYFSKTIIDYKLGKVADRETARKFSEERVKSINSFGGHQYWLNNCYEMFKLYHPFQLEDWSYYYGEASTHRGGWKGLVDYMMQDEVLRPDCGFSLVDMVEKYFVWDDLPVITKPWIGISHMTPNTPEHLAIVHIDLLLENKKFLESLKYCKYLVVLTNYMKKYIEKRLGDKVKIVVMKHPTQLDIEQWSPDNFNPVAVIALGQQMRKLSTIYTLNTDLHKIWLYGHPDKKLMEERVDIELSELNLKKSELQEVELKKVENDEYDELVTQQIVLLDIIDASANNAVVEMMGANIPFFVNRLEPVEEYLGKEYPMFFDKIEEVEEKLKDIDSLKKLYMETFEYMKSLDKTELSYDYFCSELLKLIN